MFDFISKLAALPLWSKLADAHGMLAMLALILFGAAIVLYFLTPTTKTAVNFLKTTLAALFVNLALLDIFGLTIYIPYRATGGPKTTLIASKTTEWLHTIVFEHKEFLAFAPPILILCALMIVIKSGDSFADPNQSKWLRKSVIFSIVLSLIYVLVVAAEAVLVTKTAPI